MHLPLTHCLLLPPSLGIQPYLQVLPEIASPLWAALLYGVFDYPRPTLALTHSSPSQLSLCPNNCEHSYLPSVTPTVPLDILVFRLDIFKTGWNGTHSIAFPKETLIYSLTLNSLVP